MLRPEWMLIDTSWVIPVIFEHMKRPMVLPLPGNSTKEQSFYEQQSQPIQPGIEWPGSFELDVDQSTNGAPTKPDPSPIKIERE